MIRSKVKYNFLYNNFNRLRVARLFEKKFSKSINTEYIKKTLFVKRNAAFKTQKTSLAGHRFIGSSGDRHARADRSLFEEKLRSGSRTGRL